MASLYQRDGVWCIKYQLRGRVVRRSLRTRDKRQAQESFERIVARLRNARLGIPGGQDDPLLSTLFREHLVYCKAHLSARTYRDRLLHIRDFLNPFFGDVRASGLTPRMLEEFVGKLRSWEVRDRDGNMRPAPYHPRTINLRLETLRVVLRRAVDHGDLPAMPCKIPRLKEPKALPRYARLETLKEWMAYLDIPHRLRALLSLCTGITDRDLGRVMLEDVDMGNRLLRFRRPKTDTDIVVPLNSTAMQVLAILAKDNPGPHLFPDATVKRAYYEASKAYQTAGGVNVTPHMLRHSFATITLSQGVPIAFLQQILGHASHATTQRYAKIMPDHLRAAVDVLAGPEFDLAELLALPCKKPDGRKSPRHRTGTDAKKPLD